MENSEQKEVTTSNVRLTKETLFRDFGKVQTAYYGRVPHEMALNKLREREDKPAQKEDMVLNHDKLRNMKRSKQISTKEVKKRT